MSSRNRLFISVGTILLIGLVGVWIYGGKKQTTSSELQIAAPANLIFPYLYQPEKLQLWFSGIENMTVIRETADHVDSRYQLTLNRNGRRQQYENRVLRFQENERLTVKSENATATVTLIFELDEVSPGETRLTFRRHDANIGLGRLTYLFSNRADQQATLSADIRALKQIVEEAEETPTSEPNQG